MVIIVNYHVGASRNLGCGTKYIYYSDAIVVSNKAKGRISKWMFLETKHAKFSEMPTFLTP